MPVLAAMAALLLVLSVAAAIADHFPSRPLAADVCPSEAPGPPCQTWRGRAA